VLPLALAALLTLTDPVGDLGNGQVSQPTAAVARPVGSLDVTQLELYDAPSVTFSLTFASLTNPFELRNGFTFPVIEIYLDDQLGTGSTTLLPGSGMRLPREATWKYAFKITGDSLQLFEATSNGWRDVTSQFAPSLEVQGTSIIVTSSLPRPEDLDLYGMVGSYTGFNETGWMPLSRTESPWAYSSETQVPAALDVLAPTFAAQQQALDTGVLPVITQPRSAMNPWLFVMLGGVLIAVTGLLLRFVPRGQTKTAPAQSVPQRAHPGPYKPEPLKSRIKSETPNVQTADTDETLMPGRQMAANRAKAMIVADRQARDAVDVPDSSLPVQQEETQSVAEPIVNTESIVNTTPAVHAEENNAEEKPKAENDNKQDKKPVTVDLTVRVPDKETVESAPLSLNKQPTNLFAEAVANQPEEKNKKAEGLESDITSSSAIPLFESPKVAPLPSKHLTPIPPSKLDIGASGLESWNDYEDELATFEWQTTKQKPEKDS
jgi:hypothetical protein